MPRHALVASATVCFGPLQSIRPPVAITTVSAMAWFLAGIFHIRVLDLCSEEGHLWCSNPVCVPWNGSRDASCLEVMTCDIHCFYLFSLFFNKANANIVLVPP